MKGVFKGLSILMIVGAVLMAVLSIIALVGGGLVGVLGGQAPADQADVGNTAIVVGVLGVIVGIMLLVDAIFSLLTGIFGLRGAKGDAKAAGKAKIMACITLALSLLSNISVLTQSIPDVVNILGIVISLAVQCWFIYTANTIQHDVNKLNA